MFKRLLDKIKKPNVSIDDESILEECVFYTFEKQILLSDHLKDIKWHWDLDVPDRQLVLTDETNGELICSGLIHLIGSESLETNTWLWAWANKSINHNYNSVKAVEDICKNSLSAQIFNNKAAFPIEDGLAVLFTVLCVHLTNSFCWFIGDYDGGRVYMAIEKLEPELPTTKSIILMNRTINLAIMQTVFNHRRAVMHYLGEGTVLSDNKYKWDYDDGTLTITFDDLDRIVDNTLQTR